jgi:BirA family biotin operon repressor/biotin-[acetyl-CoA-carboxylase] ligase
MTAERLRGLLPGWGLRFFATVDSTNAAAIRWLDTEDPPGDLALVVADEQTGGKGRFARPWQTPAGSAVAMSVVCEAFGSGLPQAAGVATAEAVEERLSSGAVGLKWPNDVEIDGRKVAGILIEQHRVRDRQFFVVGIGINVDVDFAALGPEVGGLTETATSIARYTARGAADVDRAELVAAVARRFSVLRGEGSLQERWKCRLTTLGREITVEGPFGLLRGRAVDTDETGCLLIRGQDGATHRVSAGDVTIRRDGFSSTR